MQLPVQITFRHMKKSDALEASIRSHANRLDQFCDRIMACRVMVESPHGHRHKGNHFHVRIDLTLPGGELVVNRESPNHIGSEDAYTAVTDAFGTATRCLEDYVRKRR